MAKELFDDGAFEYQEDPNDIYRYMYPDENGVRHGDCEDYVITFIEEAIERGLIKKGEIEWIFGKTLEGYHAWAIVTKKDKKLIFDTGNKLGRNYTEEFKDYYKPLYLVFKY